MGPHYGYVLEDHFKSWLPKAEQALRRLRSRSVADWKTFCAGADFSRILAIRDKDKSLRGAHLILEELANWGDDAVFRRAAHRPEMRPTNASCRSRSAATD